MIDSLDALFRPRSVAVIGASRSRGTIGGEILHNLVACGFEGPVYPVHRTARSVQSMRAWPSILEVPDSVDLAVVAVPKSDVLQVVDACAQKGVRAVVVVSAGFAETGPEGRALQDELVRRVRASGMRLVGPNCLGILVTDPAVRLDATFAPTWPPEGPVAFSSQSGAFGLAILDYARELGIGISSFVSVGNKADVSGNDLLEAWEEDPRTRVILLYLESLGNPTRFMRIAKRVARKKPIAVVKAGRSPSGARAASSHTGALAGLDVAVDALLGQAGVIRTDTIEELFDLAMLLANQPVPPGRRIAIVTNAGGPGIMAADACEGHGLTVASLAPETESALRTFLPKEASTRNPIDLIASATPEQYERAIETVLADPDVDAVLVLFVPPIVTDAGEVADAIRRGAAGASKPIATCLLGTYGIAPALGTLRAGHLPSYRFPEAAAIALSRAARYGEWLRKDAGAVPDLPDVSSERARAAFAAKGLGGADGRWLDPGEVREVLAAYGIPTPATTFATDADRAAQAADALGYPVAVKLVSGSVPHKTDVGGVVLGVRDSDGVREATARIRASLAGRGLAEAMSGVAVQPMIEGGVETFVGVTRDRAFGPLVGFGIGGIHVEVLRDVVFRVHPLTDVDAREMTEQIRGVRLLEGARGAPPVDRIALVDAILRIDRLVGDLPEVRELDLNPLVARPEGQGVVAVDARIRVGP